MAYRTICSQCDEPLTVQESYFESKVRCPVCKHIFVPAGKNGTNRSPASGPSRKNDRKTTEKTESEPSPNFNRRQATSTKPRTQTRSPSPHEGSETSYSCPFCGTGRPPVTEKNISTSGWIVFGVLLIFAAPLCWIGLFLKEKQYRCIDCGKELEMNLRT